jgi:hypothetical protein
MKLEHKYNLHIESDGRLVLPREVGLEGEVYICPSRDDAGLLFCLSEHQFEEVIQSNGEDSARWIFSERVDAERRLNLKRFGMPKYVVVEVTETGYCVIRAK